MTHHHHHNGEGSSGLSFEERMIKLLEHWIKHNDDHAGNYRDWAAKAETAHMARVASLLEDAAVMTAQISEKFEAAARHIREARDQ